MSHEEIGGTPNQERHATTKSFHHQHHRIIIKRGESVQRRAHAREHSLFASSSQQVSQLPFEEKKTAKCEKCIKNKKKIIISTFN